MKEVAEKLELETRPKVCDWAITMQTENDDGMVEVRSVCGKELLPVEILRSQHMSKLAANTAGEGRDKILGLSEVVGEDQTRVQNALAKIAYMMLNPPQQLEVEEIPEKKSFAQKVKGLLKG